jgi:hypothetical protein
MRAADFSWEAPPSPVKTTISSSAMIALQLRHKRHSVPPKESNACFVNSVRGCLPQSLHSPQFSEPDPIYPYLPFLFCLAFGNDCANSGSQIPHNPRIAVLQGFSSGRVSTRGGELGVSWSISYPFNTILTVQTTDYRSPCYGRALMNSSTSLAVL